MLELLRPIERRKVMVFKDKKSRQEYSALVVWEGNLGSGTSNYMDYGRGFSVRTDGKPNLVGTSDPLLLGDATLYTPEDLLLAALSSSHMHGYLTLCARNKINVLKYQDRVHAVMKGTPATGGKLEKITLEPLVVIAPGDETLAMKLHDTAHDCSIIAQAIRTKVKYKATIRVDHAANSRIRA
jgi:organic hydroperoxide reductase OsmC/OhrA